MTTKLLLMPSCDSYFYKMTTKKPSTFLGSDSDSVQSYSSEDSSDENLPAYNVCSPEKRPKLQATPSATSLASIGASSSNNRPSTSALDRGSAVKTRIEFFSSSKSHHHRGDVSCVAAASPVKNSNSFGQAKLALSPKVGYHGDGSSSHQPVTGYSLKTPPRISSAMDSPNKSPVQLAEKHGRILHQYNKLAKKIEPLTATIKKNSKLEEYRLGGGIRGLSNGIEKKGLLSFSPDGEDERHLPASSLVDNREDDRFPLPLCPPGVPILVRPAVPMTTVAPPTRDQQYGDKATPSDKEVKSTGAAASLNMKDNGLLLHVLCSQWFIEQYNSSPCPLHVWKWLFDIACLCGSPSLSSASFHTLVRLLETAEEPGHESWPVFVPITSQVLDVLASLGADKDRLTPDSLANGRLQCAPDKCSIRGGASQAVITGLTHLFSYLHLTLECRPPSLSSQDILHGVLLTVAVSLDTHLLQQSDTDLAGAMRKAMSAFLACFSEEAWNVDQDDLAGLLLSLSSHHHDCVHICHMIPSSSLKGESLRHDIIRRYLSRLVQPEKDQREWVGLSGGTTNKHLTDCRLCWSVIKHFYNQHSSTFEYYSMHSAIYLLSMLIASSLDMEWPRGVEEEMTVMLSDLGLVRIKDHADKTERVPVKERLIYFKLEMDTHKRRKSLGQMKLFKFE